MDIEKELKNNMPNASKCKNAGRLWLGTMHINVNKILALYIA